MSVHDRRVYSAPTGPLTQADPGDRVGLLGQEIAQRLFSAGLDLNYLLMLFGEDCRGADRARHAIAEIDRAIITLRHLMTAVADPG